ncbi:MAG: tetratricopeptide repeat protein [Bryobacterales bacterium]
MNRAQASGEIIAFATFEADLGARELRKAGVRIPLQEQPFEILAALLEEPGRIVSREELRGRLWPADVHVDFAQSIATAVTKLREALGDSAGNPVFVETVPRKGYRFLLPTRRSQVDGGSAMQPKTSSIIPTYLSSFVGREKELQDLKLYLENKRLVTITGPGGVGKTRLAAELAHRLEGRYADGIRFASLASARSAESVASAIGRTVGLTDLAESDSRKSLAAHLRKQSTLLVLDNLEQALEAGPLIADLLEACPGLRVLATSRSALGVRGEQVYPAPPLELPERGPAEAPEVLATKSAIALFVERARAVRPDFRLDRTTAGDVSELCVRLDGLPLAIELAAARIRLFSPRALRERLGGRLDLLSGGARDLPDRHRALRQAIAWSYELLQEEAQALFRRLSAFDGGATIEAAQAVCGHDLDCEARAYESLGVLTDHCLVRCEDGRDNEPRFSMLESIRAFGLEKLAEHHEDAAVRQAHARYFLELAERLEPLLTGDGQAEGLSQLDAEHENFRAAMQWSWQSGDAETGIRLGAALWRFWISRGHMHEGRPLLASLLDGSGEEIPAEIRSKALYGLGTLCHYQGDLRTAAEALESSLDAARKTDRPAAIGRSLAGLGWVLSLTGDFVRSQEVSEQALEDFRKDADPRGAARALNNLGWLANYTGRYADAVRLHGESLTLRREAGDERGAAFALVNLAWAERYHGDLDRSEALLDEAMEVLRPLDDRALLGWAIINRGELARERFDPGGAAEILMEGLSKWNGGSHHTILAWTHHALGCILLEWGEPERGGELLDGALDAWRALGSPWGEALTLYERGCWLAVRRRERAAEPLSESLRIRARLGDRLGLAECFESIAQATRPLSGPVMCTELMGAAARIREELQAPLPERRRRQMRPCMEAATEQLGQETFDEGLAAGRALSERQAVERALAACQAAVAR